MKGNKNWELTKGQQIRYIQALTEELAPLRARIGISQGDLAAAVGVSRQTYSAIEGRHKMMSWNTYLALILFYDYNSITHQIIREIGAFPEEFVMGYNNGQKSYINSLGIAGVPQSITEKLDDTAYQAIRTVIMLEYARCEQLPGEAVVKSFDGVDFGKMPVNEEASNALKAIKESRRSK